MAKALIQKDFDHWKVTGSLKNLLRGCVAKESTRYAIQCVNVDKDKIAATDGRRLLIAEIAHHIDPGLYYVTQDGFLIPCPNEGRFPKYEDIIQKDCETKEISGYTGQNELLSGIIFHINQQGVCCNISYLQETILTALKETYSCVIETKASDQPIQFRFSIEGGAKILYIQMPLTTN